MTKWQIDPQTGLRVGLALIVAILLLMGGLVAWVINQAVSIWTFVFALMILLLVGAVLLLSYWLVGLVRSGYTLDRNALTIIWGASEQVIPTSEIERVVLGDELEGRVRFLGIRWPGHWVGYGRVEELGPVLFYASEPPRRQIFVVTEGLAYGISPDDREGFLRTLQSRLAMGPTQIVEAISRGAAFLRWDIWRDWLGLILIGIGFLAVLALFGFLCARFPSLPRLLPLHFDSAGDPDRLGSRGQIFFLPLIGLIVLLVNGGIGVVLYRRERVGAYLLWAGASLVVIFLWTAVMGILGAV